MYEICNVLTTCVSNLKYMYHILPVWFVFNTTFGQIIKQLLDEWLWTQASTLGPRMMVSVNCLVVNPRSTIDSLCEIIRCILIPTQKWFIFHKHVFGLVFFSTIRHSCSTVTCANISWINTFKLTVKRIYSVTTQTRMNT